MLTLLVAAPAAASARHAAPGGDPALAAALRAGGGAAIDDPLVARAATGSLDVLRRVVEATPRPYGEGAAAIAERLLARPEPAAHRLAAEILARRDLAAAAGELRSALEAASPQRLGAAPALLAGLARVGDAADGSYAATWLRSPDASARQAASDALDAIEKRLLQEGRIDDAVNMLLAATREHPTDAEWLYRLVRAEGLYGGDDATAIARLAAADRALAPREPRGGVIALDDVERATAHAAVEFFAGRENEARARLRAARLRLGSTFGGVDRIALLAARIASLEAVAACAATPPDRNGARAACNDAITAAPNEPWQSRLDEALNGTLSAYVWLELLRRRGRPEPRHVFHVELEAALAAAGTRGPQDEHAHSWAPLRHGHAKFEDGDLEAASAGLAALAVRHERANAWADRWLAAEALRVAGECDLRAGDPGAALARLERALERLTELEREEYVWQVEQRIEERVEAGAPPLRTSLATALAATRRAIAEALLHRGASASEALPSLDAALRADPFDARSLLLRTALRAPEDRDAATRLLASAPRVGGALLDLARLAVALDDLGAARSLHDLHLAANALTPARRVVEEAFAARDPLLARITR
jgi:hypothetical protein